MKKYLTSGLILALALGFFSCEKQGGKHPHPAKRGGHQHERQHPRRNMLSQQAEQSADQKQEVTQQ
ncbi:MAG: hypothetical protein S4CHLAM37_12950 [Chlamydiia bacterium]|nr:hypothetical protein [Chlamydiia bacterium]